MCEHLNFKSNSTKTKNVSVHVCLSRCFSEVESCCNTQEAAGTIISSVGGGVGGALVELLTILSN